MADQGSDQTIKQMLQGFSAMQFNLGLLPMQTSQAMGGAPPAVTMPPPMIAHPGQAAAQAMAQQQAMIQQTLQAAQVTRYQPPPSAPTPAVSAIGGFSAMGNPFAASPMSGSSFAPTGGGSFAMPSTRPQVGGVFNPFAPTLPSAHFSSPAMRNLQMMQTGHSQMMGTMAGIGEGVMGIGGSVVGGVLGSAFGPLGTMAGAYLGNKIGGGLSNMMFGPAIADMARGRQVQAMTSPFMVSGSYLNTATGQGMNAQAGRDVAAGLRHLQRDYDFERTGFNTQDTMRIMQMGADQGLIKGAMSPDALVQKVKDISKTVKVLMRITGDPDVRDAIQSLGQMRELGFQGLASQAGAVANRAAFARMAGVSQSAMNQYGMMGADLAAQYGLGGATGYNAGMAGAGLANMAASSGALNDLQMARAGGKSGLAAINARGQLAAMQDERYLLAAMGRDAKGRMTVDMDAYRRTQGMSFQEVSERAAEALRTMGKEGIFEWNTRKQEFKDQVAQKLSPFEMNMNMIRQARAFQSAVPGMTLGTALQSTTGMDANSARALELQSQSRGWYDAQIQQLEAQKREAADQLAAQREQYRTPGLMTRMGRGIRGFFGDVSDAMSSPFRAVNRHFERLAEDDAAAGRGERISRYDDFEIAHNDAERQMMRRGLRSSEFRRAYRQGGSNFLDERDGLGAAFLHSAGRQFNRMGSFLGLTNQSDENRLVSIASRSEGSAFGWHPLASFGDANSAMERVQSLIGAGRAADDAVNFGAKDIESVATSLNTAGMASQGARSKNFSGSAVLRQASRNLVSRIKDLKAGVIKSASAVSANDLKAAYVKAAMDSGMDLREANASYEKNKTKINASMANDIYATSDKSFIETFAKAQEASTEAGAVNLGRSRDAVKEDIERDYKMLGFDDASEETLGKLKSTMAAHDDDVIAIAAAQNAAIQGDTHAESALREMEKSMGTEKFAQKKAQADKLLKSMDEKTQDTLGNMARGTGGGEALTKFVGKAKETFGKSMALAATNEFLQKLDDKQKGLGGAQSAEEAIEKLGYDTIENIGKTDKRFADMLTRAKKGDKTAMEEAIMYSSPTAMESRHGGGEGGGIAAIEKQIADIKELRDQVSKDDADPAQLQAASSQLFSSSVERFGKFVTDLTGNSEERALYNAAPWQQSKQGGS